MAKKISADARRELLQAIGDRYRADSKQEKARILDEFAAVTGFHRKHSIRLLNSVREAREQDELAGSDGQGEDRSHVSRQSSKNIPSSTETPTYLAQDDLDRDVGASGERPDGIALVGLEAALLRLFTERRTAAAFQIDVCLLGVGLEQASD